MGLMQSFVVSNQQMLTDSSFAWVFIVHKFGLNLKKTYKASQERGREIKSL